MDERCVCCLAISHLLQSQLLSLAPQALYEELSGVLSGEPLEGPAGLATPADARVGHTSYASVASACHLCLSAPPAMSPAITVAACSFAVPCSALVCI